MLPRIEPVTAPGGGGAGAGPGRARHAPGLSGRRLDASLAELEIDGLRPYREGAPASRIHWPTVARRGEMLERRLVAELDSAPLVVLDRSAPASEEALDSAVRAAASLCVWLGPQPAAARSCCPETAGRSRSATTSAPGRRCTCGLRWSRRAPPRPAACSARAAAP